MTDQQRDQVAWLKRWAAENRLSQIEWAFLVRVEEWIDSPGELNRMAAVCLEDLYLRAISRTTIPVPTGSHG